MRLLIVRSAGSSPETLASPDLHIWFALQRWRILLGQLLIQESTVLSPAAAAQNPDGLEVMESVQCSVKCDNHPC